MDDEDGDAHDIEDDEETKFLNFADGADTSGKKAVFQDIDYGESNKTLNRVKQFTFV